MLTELFISAKLQLFLPIKEPVLCLTNSRNFAPKAQRAEFPEEPFAKTGYNYISSDLLQLRANSKTTWTLPAQE